MGTQIPGYAQSDKVPGAYGEVVYGAGATSPGSVQVLCLIAGLKVAAGSAVADVDVKDVFSLSDARTFFGARSQAYLMCKVALMVQGVQIKAIAVAEAGGAVAATWTLTIAGAWSTVWTWGIRINGVNYTGTAGASDTVTQVAAAIAAAINADGDCPFTATSSLGVVTITCANKGTHGNRWIAFNTSAVGASGATSVLTGGTAVTGGGVPAVGGTGTEDVTNALAVLNPSEYGRIGIGQIDAANATKWKTQIAAQAGVLSGLLQHGVMASNDTLVNATTLAQTTLNEYRMQVAHHLYSESHPALIAAAMAALRTQREQNDPDASYDDVALAGIAPQSQKADWPTHSALVAALNNGVTPIKTSTDGKALIVRSIVSHSLNGANPDYATLDTGDAVVPDFALKTLKAIWIGKIVPNNPRVMDNAGPNERRRPSGVITPDIWNAHVYAAFKEMEQGKNLPAPILYQVDLNLPVSNYDSVARRIMTAATTIAAPCNHAVGVSVRQAQAA